MVSRVTLPEDDSVDIVRRTLDEKQRHRTFYDLITDDLVSQVRLYRDVSGDPTLIQPMNLRNYTDTDHNAEKRKKSLIGLYTPKEDQLPYSQLERIRKHNGLVVCPSCGEPGRPRTLDHYLPKDKFPEFSINLLNLTPMCDWCQGEKLADYITQDGRKRYIHPYFDEVNTPLFKIVFAQPYISPLINIAVLDELPPELKRLVSLHLEGISFITRFKEFFKTRYISILRKSRDCRQPNAINIRTILELSLGMEVEKSINSWDAVLYRSILDDHQLMQYLERGELPEVL